MFLCENYTNFFSSEASWTSDWGCRILQEAWRLPPASLPSALCFLLFLSHFPFSFSPKTPAPTPSLRGGKIANGMRKAEAFTSRKWRKQPQSQAGTESASVSAAPDCISGLEIPVSGTPAWSWNPSLMGCCGSGNHRPMGRKLNSMQS